MNRAGDEPDRILAPKWRSTREGKHMKTRVFIAIALALGCGADETTMKADEPLLVDAEPEPELEFAEEPSELAALENYGQDTSEQILVSEAMVCDAATGACEHQLYIDGQRMVGGDIGRLAPVQEKQTCTASNDLCRPCEIPECCDSEPDGRCPDDPPGPKWGCSGTKIQYGGPGCIAPDNTNLTYCSNVNPNDAALSGFNPGVKEAIDALNESNHILPPEWTITHRGPASGFPGFCAGWTGGSGCPTPGFNCMRPFDPQTQPTQVDILFQQGSGSLENTPNGYCNAPPTPAGQYIIGCTGFVYVPKVGVTKKAFSVADARIFKWNNGYVDINALKMIGTIITFDDANIERWLDASPASSHSRATRKRWVYQQASCHEVGHASGLTHSWVGEPGSSWWEPTTKARSCMQNIQYPEATLTVWSGGLGAGDNYDSSTDGGRNAEGWRMRNHTKPVYWDGATYKTGTWGYPLTFGTEY